MGVAPFKAEANGQCDDRKDNCTGGNDVACTDGNSVECNKSFPVYQIASNNLPIRENGITYMVIDELRWSPERPSPLILSCIQVVSTINIHMQAMSIKSIQYLPAFFKQNVFCKLQ